MSRCKHTGEISKFKYELCLTTNRGDRVRTILFMIVVVLVAAFFIGCMQEEGKLEKTPTILHPAEPVEALIEAEAPDLGIDAVEDIELNDTELDTLVDDLYLGID